MEQIDTTPPIGNVEFVANTASGNPLWGMGKFMFINFVEGKIRGFNIPFIVKFLMITGIHGYMMKNTLADFKDTRALSLYDHFNVSRLAKFDELKIAKDFYLDKIKQRANHSKDNIPADLIPYNMTRV
jgi:hypothetical protein